METIIVSTGIKTRYNQSEDPYGYIVEWIEWDSEFRRTGLQHADILVGVNEKLYLKENHEQDHPKAIGNYLESSFWSERQAQDGQEVVLTIVRDQQTIYITGKLSQQRLYFDKENRQCFGLNGPARMSKDIFSSVWANWYEKFVKYLGLYIDDRRWERSAIDNRRLLTEHQEWRERINYLVQYYPGQFAHAADRDWQLVQDILAGIRYTDIKEDDLEYRKIGEQRVLLVRDAGAKAQTDFIKSVQARLIEAFPAIDTIHGNINEVAGKIVALPTIGFNRFINDLGKSFAVIGSTEDGFYFIHLNSTEMDVFFKTLFHYQAQVTPELPEQYQFIAEILQEPAILSYDGRPVTGLMVKTMAGMAGEQQVFINTGSLNVNGRAFFAGEEILTAISGYQLESNASPGEVLQAMISYIKLGDMSSWQKLFSNWQIYEYGDGLPYMDLMYAFSEEMLQHAWSKSRQQILNDVYDARILYTGPVKTIIPQNTVAGIPQVQQVKIIIDHIGKFEEGFCSISNLYLHRKWILQRLDSGPWKIIHLQPL